MRPFNLLAVNSTLLLAAVLVVYAWLDPAGFARQLAKDGTPGGGLVEDLTVVVLIPGILAGLYAFYRYRHRLPHPLLGYWVLAWSLACIYFAGEEASWGQWYFRWETPELLKGLNDQRETNVHNISSWLDQKPRALVELFIIIAGFALPLWRLLGGRPVVRRGFLAAWENWIYAPAALLPAGLLFVAIRIARWLPPVSETFGDSELRELAVAWFLMWYLISYAARLR